MITTMPRTLIDTDAVSERYRAAAVDPQGRRLLLTNFQGSAQEPDLSEPPNCGGFGRIRHFHRATRPGWPENPLPIDPACRALGMPPSDTLRAQVFQNAVCNWRCWYCFVPFNLLVASREHSDWLSPAQMVDLYLTEEDRPPMIDLTGGQPDLTPEWVPWMMAELRARGLENNIYLWSDDNLSNDYFWRFLTDADRDLVRSYPSYGRVCCFKGFDAASFSFNTKAAPALFDRQFALMGRFVEMGIDLYAYATFTAPSGDGLRGAMRAFVDRLQRLHHNLPLRTVPLEIEVFSPVRSRLDDATRAALDRQRHAILAWQEEMARRFSSDERSRPVVDVPL
jgi:uncharacterized Fe-S cluster-containing radical SAM superfamily protein